MLSACIVTHLRATIREKYRIEGNMVSDLLHSAFIWPQVLCQLQEELKGRDSHIDADASMEA